MKSTLQTTPVNVLAKAHMTNANDMAFGRYEKLLSQYNTLQLINNNYLFDESNLCLIIGHQTCFVL